MMLILPLSLNVQVHPGSVAETLEEMEKHLGRHIAHLLTMELSLPNQPRPAAEIEGHLAKAIVHRQAKAVTLNATLVAQSLGDSLTQGDGGILNRMVLVHLQVALDQDLQIHPRMLADLLEHMVEKAQPGRDHGFPRSVEVEPDLDIGFLGDPLDGRGPLAGEEIFRHPVPIVGDEIGRQGTMISRQLLARAIRLPQPDSLGAQISGQLDIGQPIANDITVRQIVIALQIFRQHPDSRLTVRRVLLRERGVDTDLIELDPLARQRLQDQVVRRPEGLLRKGIGSQPVLVGDHHQLQVRVLTDKIEAPDHLRDKLQFLQAVQLIIYGRLLYDRAVAVNK